MLFVVNPKSQEKLMDIFRKWGLKVAVVGKVLEENIVRVLHKGQIAAELPANALAEDTPINQHTLLNEPPLYIQTHWNWKEETLPNCCKLGAYSLTFRTKFNGFYSNKILEVQDKPIMSMYEKDNSSRYLVA